MLIINLQIILAMLRKWVGALTLCLEELMGVSSFIIYIYIYKKGEL